MFVIVTYCFSCHDLNTWGLWQSLFNVVRGGGGTDDNAIPDEVKSYYRVSFINV